MRRHMSKHLSKFIKTMSCLTNWNVTSHQTFNLSQPNIQSCCFVCWGRGAFFLFFLLILVSMFYLNQLFQNLQTPKFRLFFTVTTIKSELEGNIKSRSFIPLDILEFRQQRNKWWSSTLLNAFNRDFHKAANFNFWEVSLSDIFPSVEKSFYRFFWYWSLV